MSAYLQEVLMEGRNLTTLDEELVLADARDAVVDLYRRTGVETPNSWPTT